MKKTKKVLKNKKYNQISISRNKILKIELRVP